MENRASNFLKNYTPVFPHVLYCYHEMLLETFDPLSHEGLCSRIFLVVLSPLAYLALIFGALIEKGIYFIACQISPPIPFILSTQIKQNSVLFSVPSEILKIILSCNYIDSSLLTVCKHFRNFLFNDVTLNNSLYNFFFNVQHNKQYYREFGPKIVHFASKNYYYERQGLDYISLCPNIKSLSLFPCFEHGRRFLQENKHLPLVTLKMLSGNLRNSDVNSICSFTQLTHLDLGGNRGINVEGDIEIIKSLTSLKFLGLGSHDLLEGDLEILTPYLKNLKQLESFTYSGNSARTSIAAFSTTLCTLNLTSLAFIQCYIDSTGCKILIDHFTNLKSLNLEYNQIDVFALKYVIQKGFHLENLDISNNYMDWDAQISLFDNISFPIAMKSFSFNLFPNTQTKIQQKKDLQDKLTIEYPNVSFVLGY